MKKVLIALALASLVMVGAAGYLVLGAQGTNDTPSTTETTEATEQGGDERAIEAEESISDHIAAAHSAGSLTINYRKHTEVKFAEARAAEDSESTEEAAMTKTHWEAGTRTVTRVDVAGGRWKATEWADGERLDKYYDGTELTLRRVSDGNETTFTRARTQSLNRTLLPDDVREAIASVQYGEPTETEAGGKRYNGESLYADSELRPQGSEASVESVSSTLVIGPDGHITRFTLSLEKTEQNGDRTTVKITYESSDPGNTAVENPDWAATGKSTEG